MFPTVSHFLEYLFGIQIPLPFNTFGMFVALAFIAAYWAFSKELQRKEADGLVYPVKKKVTTGAPASLSDMILNALFGFVIGFKLLYAVFNYREFVADPQNALMSWKGSWLGGLVLAAFFAWWDYKEKQKTRLEKPVTKEVLVHPYQLMSTIVVWAAVWGFLGAKVFDSLEYWDEFVADPIGRLTSFSGLTFYGGLICGGAAVLYIARKNGIKPVHMLDVGAPGMMLSYAVGRMGCHFSGDGDWGIVNKNPKPFDWLPDWLWAYRYPHNVVGEGVPIPGCVGKFCNQLPEPVYPTAIYEVIACLILFGVIWSLRKRIKAPGMLFGIYLIMNGVERFFVELIRVNSKYHVAGLSFTQAEMISSLLVVAGILLVIWSSRQPAELIKSKR
nr:prolipoprotein diacylglyceryl transferase family protein [Pedobacter sp. SYP-B3415]